MAGRNDRGQFTAGNKFGRGRQPLTKEERYYKIAKRAVTFKEWRLIVKRAVTDAMRGNAAARTWLTHLLLGPLAPPDAVFTTTLPEALEEALLRGYGDGDDNQGSG